MSLHFLMNCDLPHLIVLGCIPAVTLPTLYNTYLSATE